MAISSRGEFRFMQIIDDPYSGNIFGRLGKGIGQGLSEQLPKEIERTRLASGLKKLEQEKDLDPFQFFTKAASLPGMNPQLLDSLANLSKQRLKNQAFQNYGGNASPDQQIEALTRSLPMAQDQGNFSSITKPAGTKAAQETFIPRDLQTEIIPAAVAAFKENPARFHNDIDEAIDFEQSKDANRQQINQAYEQQRTSQLGVQDRLLSDFRNYIDRRNINTGSKGSVNVPENELDILEKQLIKMVLPKSQGGGGKTEEEAARESAKDADKIARQYSSLRTKGGLKKYIHSPTDVLKELEPIRKEFAKRGMEENFADELVGALNVNPRRAYALTFKLPKDSSVVKELDRMPGFIEKVREAGPGANLTPIRETEKLAPIFADLIGDNSPLAIADALTSKGYDPDVFLNYVVDHQDELDLDERQIREIGKSRSSFGALGNIYYNAMKGK